MGRWLRRSKLSNVNETLAHDCNCREWGNHTWMSIHYALAKLPTKLNKKIKAATWEYLVSFGSVAPCKSCRRNWRIIMDRLENHRESILQSAQTASCMFFDLHNVWNLQLGKDVMTFSTFKDMYGCDFDRVHMYDRVTNVHINLEDMVVSAEKDTRRYGDSSDDSRESIGEPDNTEYNV